MLVFWPTLHPSRHLASVQLPEPLSQRLLISGADEASETCLFSYLHLRWSPIAPHYSLSSNWPRLTWLKTKVPLLERLGGGSQTHQLAPENITLQPPQYSAVDAHIYKWYLLGARFWRLRAAAAKHLEDRRIPLPGCLIRNWDQPQTDVVIGVTWRGSV